MSNQAPAWPNDQPTLALGFDHYLQEFKLLSKTCAKDLNLAPQYLSNWRHQTGSSSQWVGTQAEVRSLLNFQYPNGVLGIWVPPAAPTPADEEDEDYQYVSDGEDNDSENDSGKDSEEFSGSESEDKDSEDSSSSDGEDNDSENDSDKDSEELSASESEDKDSEDSGGSKSEDEDSQDSSSSESEDKDSENDSSNKLESTDEVTANESDCDGAEAAKPRRRTVVVDQRDASQQSKFRKQIGAIYSWTCIISGADFAAGLEAAHINSWSEGGSYDTNNGLMLRCDLHKLFDDNQWSLEETPTKGTYRVTLSQKLAASTHYGELQDKLVVLPHASSAHLAAHHARRAE